MNLQITNEEKRLKVCFRKLRSTILRILAILQLPSKVEISLAFVTKSTMQELNRTKRGKDSVTDVLSFPSAEIKSSDVIDFDFANKLDIINPENGHIMLGDIVVCTVRAAEQADELGHLLEAEVVRLVVHSILHLIGYDHISDGDYLSMHKKEMAILKELGYNFKG